MSKKIISLTFFALILCIKSYSQNTTSATKVLYKITPEQAKNLVIDEKRFDNISKGGKSIYSCEIDHDRKKAIISVKDNAGVITKETYILKEEKRTTNK